MAVTMGTRPHDREGVLMSWLFTATVVLSGLLIAGCTGMTYDSDDVTRIRR